MDLTYILGLIGAAFGFFLYNKKKRDSAEALLENLDTKKSVNKLEADSLKAQAGIEAEQDKLNQAKAALDKAKLEGNNEKDLVDFFNNSKPK